MTVNKGWGQELATTGYHGVCREYIDGWNVVQRTRKNGRIKKCR
jgi:hypothetical protein